MYIRFGKNPVAHILEKVSRQGRAETFYIGFHFIGQFSNLIGILFIDIIHYAINLLQILNRPALFVDKLARIQNASTEDRKLLSRFSGKQRLVNLLVLFFGLLQ